MAQKSYNQVIDHINTFADSHKQIKNFSSGFEFDLNTLAESDNNYPILYVQPTSHQLTGEEMNLQTYSLRIYSLDLKTKDSYNEKEVLSDCLQILNDVIKYLKLGVNDSDYEFDVINSPVAIPVTNYTVEYCSGWYVDIDLETLFNTNDCDIPLT